MLMFTNSEKVVFVEVNTNSLSEASTASIVALVARRNTNSTKTFQNFQSDLLLEHGKFRTALVMYVIGYSIATVTLLYL